MEKHFICLANSLKRGGRCIAGIEIEIGTQDHWRIIRNPNGTPHWIRPIDPCTDYGEITNSIALPIQLLSVVKLTEVQTCPHGAHSEDVYFSQISVIGQIIPSLVHLHELTDVIHTEIFYNSEYSISPLTYANGDYSLMFIHPERIWVEPDLLKERAKYRMRIAYRGNSYEMSVTDPNYLKYLGEQMQDGGFVKDAYLCLSLGLEYEFRHHKLVAGVVEPNIPDSSAPFTFVRTPVTSRTELQVRPLTWKERLSIKSAFYIPTYKGASVYIHKWNGKEMFVTLEGNRELEARTKIKLHQVLFVTYIDEKGNTTNAFRWKT